MDRKSSDTFGVDLASKGAAAQQFELARAMATGCRGTFALSAAVHWLENAAEQGHPGASELLEEIRNVIGTNSDKKAGP